MKNTLVEFNNWLSSDEGRGCLTTSCEINEAVLYNRLRQAFYAGKEVNNFERMKEILGDALANQDQYEYLTEQTQNEIKQLLESIK